MSPPAPTGTATLETFSSGGVEIAFRVWPNPRADHIVILAHGYAEHSGRYEDVARFLVAGGAVVAGPDHLGHGRSGGERALMPDCDRVVDDLHVVVERLRERHPGLPVVLVGHSLGGLLSVRYAQLHPGQLAGLVFASAPVGTFSAATGMLALEEIPKFSLDTSALSRDPAVAQAYSEDELVWHGHFKRPTIEGLDVVLKAVNAGPKLGALPILWLRGDADRSSSPEETRAGFDTLEPEDLREVVYPGARHELFHETNQLEVFEELSRFVARVTAS